MSRSMPITWLADDGDTTVTRNVPFNWAICPVCEGHATDRGASVECDGGGFTASEWAEQDDDFKQDYLNGAYDKPCSACKGLGRVQEPDLTALSETERGEYEQSQRDDAAYRRERAAEIRMGY
jgi:hypothetical protein